LRTCTQEHELCLQKSKALPRRLLNIRNLDNIRLIETQDEISMRYIALSYCWGHVDSLKTTQDNISRFRKGFGIGELPLVIINAIDVAHYLDTWYIWVYALCIIQDDVENWERESATMGTVYE
jgi:hypothetical protein